MIKRTLFGCALALSAGCSSDDAVDIGDGRVGQSLRDYADDWEGYAEAHEFNDGSDRVRLRLDGEGNGVLLVGDSSSPDNLGAALPDDPWYLGLPAAGFEYPVSNALVDARRLRFEVDLKELYRSWCEEQPPVLYQPEHVPGVYSCLPNGSLTNEQGECLTLEGQVFPCEAISVCSEICECTAESCSIGDHPAAFYAAMSEDPDGYFLRRCRFDGALADDGNTLQGTLANCGPQPLTVRLERQ